MSGCQETKSPLPKIPHFISRILQHLTAVEVENTHRNGTVIPSEVASVGREGAGDLAANREGLLGAADEISHDKLLRA
jgi:hypothetical protein